LPTGWKTGLRLKAASPSAKHQAVPGSPGMNIAPSTCWPFDSLTPGPMRYVVHATMLQTAAMKQDYLIDR
jgi:hypothetical protein